MTLKGKLLSIQKDLKCSKSNYSEYGKYHYRSCEDILEGVKPLLVKENVLLTLEDEIEAIGTRIYVKANAKLNDIDSDEEIIVSAYAREEENKRGMDGSQVTGASSSYARKYALNGLFCIDDTKDSDTDEFKQQNQKQNQQQNQELYQEPYQEQYQAPYQAPKRTYKKQQPIQPEEPQVVPQPEQTIMPANAEQIETLNRQDEKVKDFAIRKYGVASLEQLAFNEADYIINSLEQKGILK